MATPCQLKATGEIKIRTTCTPTMLVSIMSVSLLSYHIPWQAAELSFEQFATILDSTIEITLSRQWGKETKEKFL